jgi:hypothetical protein
MIELVIIQLVMIAIGVCIYIIEYRNKEKPKMGIKRDTASDYLKDYARLKLYWTSIAFIVVGISVLIAMLIIEIAFSF